MRPRSNFSSNIHGTTAEGLQAGINRATNSWSGTYGTAEQHARFLEQMAKIQAEIATF